MKINWKIASGILFVLYLRNELVLYKKVQVLKATQQRLRDRNAQRVYYAKKLDDAGIPASDFDQIVRDYHKQ